MNERMSNMNQMALAHQQQLQQLQPNLKGFASPAITPSSNFNVGKGKNKKSGAAGDRSNLSIITSISQGGNGGLNSQGPQSIKNMASIHGRRVDSPELKVAVNKEIQDQRPHTAGHPFLLAAAAGGQLVHYKNEEFFTIINPSQVQSAMQTAQNTITLSNYYNPATQPLLNMTANNKHRAQPSQAQYDHSSLRNRQNNVTISHEDPGVIRSGRHNKMQSKSQHPNQKRKKNQTSRSAPKASSFVNTNIQAQIVNSSAQQIFNINIHNAKHPQTTTQKNQPPAPAHAPQSAGCPIGNMIQRKRAAVDQTKFHSLGGQQPLISNSLIPSGVMSAPNKSKSRSRSLRRRQDQQPVPNNVRQGISQPKTAILKPPKPSNLLNRSSINKDTLEVSVAGGQGGPIDVGISFDHKEKDDSIAFNEFSPSREGLQIKGKKGANFLDSDSSLSSPKAKNNHHHLFHAIEAASSGPQTGKNHYINKQAFMKNFSPERSSITNDLHVGGNALSSSDRNSSREVTHPVKQTRVNLGIVDKMMKEKFKEFRAREEAEDQSRRRIQQENLIKKQIQKKAEQQQSSQRNIMKKGKLQQAVAEMSKQHKISSQMNSGLINVHNSHHLRYKKQRSKSCMNQTDDIFGGLQSKASKQAKPSHPSNVPQKKKQQGNPNLSNINEEKDTYFEAMKQDILKIEAQPKQPSQQNTQKRREKSFFVEMKELKRQCVEEIKREYLAGKIDTLPSSAANNKRIGNNLLNVQNKDSKQSANTYNQQSKGELNNNTSLVSEGGQDKKRTNSKGREQQQNNISMIQKNISLNPTVINKVKKFIETKKKLGGYIPKSMEQTIDLEKKLRIQSNLDKLQKNIKQTFKHQTFGMPNRKADDESNTSAVMAQVQTNGNTTSININIKPTQPEKKLKTQVYSHHQSTKNQGKRGVFDYKSELHENSEIIGSNSLTPDRISRKNIIVPPESDMSIEMQQEYQNILNDIQKRHELTHNGKEERQHISKSNPQVGSRRIAGYNDSHHQQQPDAFSIDISSICGHRDSSHDNKKKSPAKKSKLENELNQRFVMKKEEQKKMRWMDKKKSHSTSKDRRSNSSPNTLIANPMPSDHQLISIVPSDNKTMKDQTGLVTTGNQPSFNGQASNSNNASTSMHELQHKIKILAEQYGPHIKGLQKRKGVKSGRVSKTQMLVTLHSAAIVIQQHYRKRLVNKGFYDSSITYINTSEDGFSSDPRNQTIDYVQNRPERVLTANTSPLRTKPVRQNVLPNNDIKNIGNQFYSASINEKVVQMSVISSGGSQSNIGVKQNQEAPQSAPLSLPQSGFSTAIKNPLAPIDNIEEESKSIIDTTNSPIQAHQQARSDQKPETTLSSGSRRAAIPPLNLSQLAGTASEPPAKPSPQAKPEPKPLHPHNETHKTLFDKHSFQDFFDSHQHTPLTEAQLLSFPEMLRLREEIINRKEETEKKLLSQQLKAEEFSPRTYKMKTLELEKWVTKEQEEVKKTRKKFEKEYQKTQQIISEVAKNHENMKRLLVEQNGCSTHRSRGPNDMNGGDHSYRMRADSNRMHSSRHDKQQSFLDAIEDIVKTEPDEYIEVIKKPSHIEHHLKPSEPMKFNQKNEELKGSVSQEKVIDQFQPLVPNQFNPQPTGGKIKVVDGGAQLSSESDDRLFKREDDESDPYQDSDQSPRQENALKKGLSRTKGSLQLPNINNNDEESNNGGEREQPYLITTNNHLGSLGGDEMGGSSDFKKNFCDTSLDEGEKSPDLKDQIKKENFFINNFDSGNAQNIIDQVKHQSNHRKSSPDASLEAAQVKIHQKSPDQEQNQGEKPPQPPTPSPDHQRVMENDVINYQDHRPRELDDIEIELPPINPSDLIHVPVSPVSNPDAIPMDTIGSGHGGPTDTRIITGGGSLNSTLSAGEAGFGNQDLVRVIHEVQREEMNKQKSPESEAASEEDKLVELVTSKKSNNDEVAANIADEIFQNLMAELRLDLELLMLNDPRIQNAIRREEQKERPQQLGDSGRFPIFDRRGIQTDLFAIERYVEEVLQEVLHEKDRFMHHITLPLSKIPSEVLNQLQNSEIGSYEHFEQHFPPILPLETYLKLERRRKDQRSHEAQEGGAAEARNFLAECEHIHNKVLFDCINDSLLQFKPYAKDGEPLPWSRQNRRLKPLEDFTIEEMFEIVKHDLFRWAIMQAGTLPRREFVFGGMFDEELFAEIREKKLATLLAREMIENEPKWLNYEFEEAQVKIDIGDMILEQLVTETINILNEKKGGNRV